MKRFLLTLAFSLTILAGLAQAQAPLELSNLEIDIWPEFDRPDVLVIHRGLLAADTSLPVPVEIRIPARVGQPTAVAYVGEGGQRFNQPYSSRVEGDWLVVTFELATQGFQLEYYDELPVDATGQRQYTYSYTPDYPIAELSLEFQVPPTAEGFALDPAADSVIQKTDGLTYHLVQVGTVDRGDDQSWTFAYQKANEDLTVSAFVQPQTPVPAAAPGAQGGDSSGVLIFLIAFIGLIAVGAGAFWLGRRTQGDLQETHPSSRPHKRRGSGRGMQAEPQQTPSPGSQEVLFCHQCGTELRSDSDYCHRCGTTVRRG